MKGKEKNWWTNTKSSSLYNELNTYTSGKRAECSEVVWFSRTLFLKKTSSMRLLSIRSKYSCALYCCLQLVKATNSAHVVTALLPFHGSNILPIMNSIGSYKTKFLSIFSSECLSVREMVLLYARPCANIWLDQRLLCLFYCLEKGIAIQHVRSTVVKYCL